MALQIKELPETERPYEKLELYGEKKLSNAELLAIIIKTGTKELTSVDIAKQILNLNKNKYNDNLNFLRDLSLEELMQIKGVGRVKAIQIKAICELSNRMNKPSNYKKIKIESAKDIANLLMNELRFEKQEMVKLIILNNKNIILKIIDIAQGGVNSATTDVKLILSEIIKMSAPQFVLVHNHPSGDATPSKKDIEFTIRLKKGASLLGINLLDHIVIGDMEYQSIFLNKKYKEMLRKEI